MKLFLLGVLLLAMSALGQKSVQDLCPPFLVANVDEANFRTYDKYCYLISTTAMFYAAAEGFCNDYGNGTLFMPRTSSEHSVVLNALDDLGITDPAWIGISDREVEGKFVYADGSELEIRAFNFFSNPILAGVQDCVALDPSSGIWNRYRCAGTLFSSADRPFVCQYNI